MLPYIEQLPLYEQLDWPRSNNTATGYAGYGAVNGRWWDTTSMAVGSGAQYTVSANAVAATTRVNQFLCPSNNPNPTPVVGYWCANHEWNDNQAGGTFTYTFANGTTQQEGYWGPYIFSGGTQLYWAGSGPEAAAFVLAGLTQAPYAWAWTNYFGVAGTGAAGTHNAALPFGIAISQYVGVFTDRSTNTVTDITNGTSNTLMFGESQGGLYNGQPTFLYPWIGSCVMDTRFGLPATGANSDWRQFSSGHPGVVMFCFCDGSVRTLLTGTSNNFTMPAGGPTAANITTIEDGSYACTAATLPQDWFILQALAGMRDNQPIAHTQMLP